MQTSFLSGKFTTLFGPDQYASHLRPKIKSVIEVIRDYNAHLVRNWVANLRLVS